MCDYHDTYLFWSRSLFISDFVHSAQSEQEKVYICLGQIGWERQSFMKTFELMFINARIGFSNSRGSSLDKLGGGSL